MRTKAVSLLLAFSLCLTACGGNGNGQQPDPNGDVETDSDPSIDGGIDDTGRDSMSGLVDIVVTDLELEPVPPREVANFHIKIKAQVSNEGTTAAKGLDCMYRIEPTENTSIETLQGSVPVDDTTLDPGNSREVVGELDRDAESGDQNYDARFEIRCFVDNENASGDPNNAASGTSTVNYF